MLSISMIVPQGKLDIATSAALSELRRLREEPIADEELQKAQTYATGSFILGLESTMSRSQRAGEMLLTVGRIEPVEEVVTNLKAVTAMDVQRVAQRIFRVENLALAVIGPEAQPNMLRKLLTI